MATEDASGGFVISGRTVFLLFFILIHLAIASQVYWLAKDIAYGDGSCDNLTIPLRYPPMRVPALPITEQHHATNRLCADFALIYFQSLEPGSMRGMYELDSTVDLWGRPSRYSPLMHVICSNTLSKMPYGQACLVHLGIQYLLFLASFIVACSVLQIKKYQLHGILIANTCLFLTPVGLSFFERGQYTLYVGLCYLWLMLAIVTGKKRYLIMSALFGFLKWTSLPFVFVTFAVSILGGQDVKSIKKIIAMAGIYVLTFMGLLLLTPDYSMGFLKGLLFQELELIPMGNSLVRVVPRYVVKSMPFIMIAVGILCRFISKKPPTDLILFFAGTATILVTYPTMAFDYSVPYLTAFIPFLIYWSTLTVIHRTIGAPVVVLFSIMLLLASFGLIIFNSEIAVIMTYVAIAIALIIAQLFTNFRSQLLESNVAKI